MATDTKTEKKSKQPTKAQQAEAIAAFDKLLDAEVTHAQFYRNLKGVTDEQKLAMRESVVAPAERTKADGSPVDMTPKFRETLDNFAKAVSTVDLGQVKDKSTGELTTPYEQTLKFPVSKAMLARMVERTANPEAKEPKLTLHEKFFVHNNDLLDKSGSRGRDGQGVYHFSIAKLKERVRARPETAHIAVDALKAAIAHSRLGLGNMEYENMRQRQAKAKEAAGQER